MRSVMLDAVHAGGDFEKEWLLGMSRNGHKKISFFTKKFINIGVGLSNAKNIDYLP